MKKLKYLFWLIFIAFFALLVYQNLEFFSAKNALHIDLGFYQYSTPMLTNGAIIAGFVGIGVFVVLVFYFASRYGVYRANKTIKELRNDLNERSTALNGLKEEMASIRSDANAVPAPSEQTEQTEAAAAPSETEVSPTSQV
jgi:uncharacterized membrane protein YciS (DUF1049 family)